jgi:hypothetical protein
MPRNFYPMIRRRRQGVAASCRVDLDQQCAHAIGRILRGAGRR